MKHYTLAEHRTFCIESGIPNGEVWREVVKLGWMPEGILHNPDQAFNPERKEKQKEYHKKRRSTPEAKAKQKEFNKKRQSTSEYKAYKKEYDKKRWRNMK